MVGCGVVECAGAIEVSAIVANWRVGSKLEIWHEDCLRTSARHAVCSS